MIDSDNALLLKPVRLGPGYPALDAPRTHVTGQPIIAGAVYHRGAADDGFVEYFTDHVAPVLTGTGAAPVAVFESLVAENNFPQLPLRDEVVLTWFARFPECRRTTNTAGNWRRPGSGTSRCCRNWSAGR